MKYINLQKEWNLLVKEFGSHYFSKRTIEQKEKWFNLQLLLTAIGNTKDRRQKIVLGDLYFRLKYSFS